MSVAVQSAMRMNFRMKKNGTKTNNVVAATSFADCGNPDIRVRC